jgi:hypothetical protein
MLPVLICIYTKKSKNKLKETMRTYVVFDRDDVNVMEYGDGACVVLTTWKNCTRLCKKKIMTYNIKRVYVVIVIKIFFNVRFITKNIFNIIQIRD